MAIDYSGFDFTKIMVYQEITHLKLLYGTIVLLLLFMGGILFVPGCAKKEAPQNPGVPMVLDSVVVKEYTGKKLSELCASGEEEGKTAEQVDIETYALSISGMVASAQAHSYDEILDRQRYQKTVTIESADGWSETLVCEGVLISDLISTAGPSPGAIGVVFRSVDGYEVSFPLDYILDNKIILAHRIDGKALTPEGGFPFTLISESNQGHDWAKWVTEIELADNIPSKD